MFPAEMHVSQHAVSVTIPDHEIFSNLTRKASQWVNVILLYF